jgi:hypothetical protein
MNGEIGGITRESLLEAIRLIPKLNSQKPIVVDLLSNQMTNKVLLSWKSEYDKWVEKEDPEQI